MNLRNVLKGLTTKTSKHPTQCKKEISFPPDFTTDEIGDVLAVKDYTMTGLERLISFSGAVDFVEGANLQGDIVECGVWKGGTMMLAARRLVRHR